MKALAARCATFAIQKALVLHSANLASFILFFLSARTQLRYIVHLCHQMY